MTYRRPLRAVRRGDAMRFVLGEGFAVPITPTLHYVIGTGLVRCGERVPLTEVAAMWNDLPKITGWASWQRPFPWPRPKEEK